MPRQARLVLPGLAHHVTQRGNYQQDVFHKNEDYLTYCHWMSKYASLYGLDILAFCLMTNHVHLIVIPHDYESMARTFNTVHMRYAQYHNRQWKIKGHLWQGRFYSSALDDQHLYRALRYVERNPVRARMVKNAWEYPWSSVRWHLGMDHKSGIFLKKTTIVDKKEWRGYLMEEDEEFNKEIRLKTQRGLIVGGRPFIEKLERKLKRSLICLNPGRPRKT